ncbi:putative receptor protein kinase ZmPK1 [Rhododendron vialii]|uniref:putative receptor protein kinase ZmPK1 n=1 Tax=Rhododendron vialii TaxID=182163 RepID=UPI00265F29A9|nr:putative receptor protein kinase ZmPK1 [Rhododendron vialii]
MFGLLHVWWWLYKTQQSSNENAQGCLQVVSRYRKFTHDELKKATRKFKEEIGRGGGGVVYKGILPDRSVAAIKRLNEATQGEAELLAEVSTIGRVNHMNLIEIWGYCVEGNHRLLVYEYMERGSFAKNFISSIRDWERRYDIAVGSAKGLAYLHEECLEWVLHCDVKPQNILLDSNFQPKVADFGLSKLVNRRGGGKSLSFSRVRGTRGFMAPEWNSNLPITSKVDVYSYGVVVLEMVTGKSPMTTGGQGSENTGEMEQRGLVKWTREKMNRNGENELWLEEIIDPLMKGKCDLRKMGILVLVALECVEEDKNARPTMSQVIERFLPHEKG